MNGILLRINSGILNALTMRNWIKVKDTRPGIYFLTDDGITCRSCSGPPERQITVLCISKWDGEVENLDNGRSKGSRNFGISTHLKWQDVELMRGEFRAPSIKRLKEALKHVTFQEYYHADVC